MIIDPISTTSCGSCRRCENMENHKTGFPHFHSALENLPLINPASSFPQLPQDPARRTVLIYLHGEYPVEVWHGVTPVSLLSDELILTDLIEPSCAAH
jgi:hypothetical protein